MTKKEEERLYLDRFIELLGEGALGEIKPNESPDFLITTSKGVLGIETTFLFRDSSDGGSPMKERESLHERVVRHAQRVYESKNGLPLHVTVAFNSGYRLAKANVDQFGDALASLVLENIPQLGATWEYGPNRDNAELLPREFLRVYAFRHPSLTRNSWGRSDGGFVPELGVASFQNTISVKDAKITTYRQSCAKVWLLICCSGVEMSSWYEFSEDALRAAYSSRFDRIYWISYQGKIRQLSTTSSYET